MTARPQHVFTLDQRANGELAERGLRCGVGRALHRPTQVYLQIASACNLACTMCSEANRPEDARFGRGLVSFSPELFERLERDVFPWSSELILGVGGEPTYSPNFVDYVRRAARANQRIRLVTNGTYLEREAVAAAIAEHVAEVRVSIDAASERTYEAIRVGSRWKRLCAGLERLSELRRSAPFGRTSRVAFCFVLMRSNVDELPAFVELAARFGAERVHAQHVIAMTDASVGESLLAEPERYDAAWALARRRAHELGVALEAPQPFGGGPNAIPRDARTPESADEVAAHAAGLDPALAGFAVPCRSPNQAIVVLYDGRVFACCHPLAHEKMQLGDLRRQSFEAIWNGPSARFLRAGMKTGDAPWLCRTCSIVHSPPPVAEVARELAGSPTLAEHYAGRAETTDDETARAALAEYVRDLRRHADELASERGRLAAHAATITEERDALKEHSVAITSQRDGLARHAANLQAELDGWKAHAHRSSSVDASREPPRERAWPLAFLRRLFASRAQPLPTRGDGPTAGGRS
ncbi:MAG: radical SAM protein [Planctomycetes bacterium]|nr:radical SAM protein [Planctomycetota bacterium]